MKISLKIPRGLKASPLIIVGASVIGVCLVVSITASIAKYNSAKQAIDTKISVDKEKEKLSQIIAVENGKPVTSDPGPTQSPAGSTASGRTSSSQSNANSQTSPSNTASSATPSNPSTPPASTSTDGDTPQVALTYPSVWGQTVSGIINMTASASDSGGVQKVVFMIRKIGLATPVFAYEDTSAPYSASFDTRTLPNGGSEYTVEAQVFDNAGKGNLASLRINIQN